MKNFFRIAILLIFAFALSSCDGQGSLKVSVNEWSKLGEVQAKQRRVTNELFETQVFGKVELFCKQVGGETIYRVKWGDKYYAVSRLYQPIEIDGQWYYYTYGGKYYLNI